MDEVDPTQPAYPSLKHTGEGYGGLSKLHLTSAMLLSGLLANPNVTYVSATNENGQSSRMAHNGLYINVHPKADKLAVRMATHLINELNREPRHG